MIVVKIGGGGGVDLEACCDDLAGIAQNERVVLVHGGSQAATHLGDALGHAPAFLTAPSGVRSRYTDARTLEIFTMALARINTEVVAALQARQINALGLSGVDGRVLEARRKEAVVAVEPDGRRRVIRDDRSGTLERVDVSLVSALLAMGYLPVISPPAYSPDGPVNVDGDRAAALVATALQADALVILTNVPGLLRDRDDDASLVRHVQVPENLDAALGLAAGRMRIKVMAARDALGGGVPRAIIADGQRDGPISRALAGEGTVFDAKLSTGAPATDEPALASRAHNAEEGK